VTIQEKNKNHEKDTDFGNRLPEMPETGRKRPARRRTTALIMKSKKHPKSRDYEDGRDDDPCAGRGRYSQDCRQGRLSEEIKTLLQ
jgi:hypothetical protein